MKEDDCAVTHTHSHIEKNTHTLSHSRTHTQSLTPHKHTHYTGSVLSCPALHCTVLHCTVLYLQRGKYSVQLCWGQLSEGRTFERDATISQNATLLGGEVGEEGERGVLGRGRETEKEKERRVWGREREDLKEGWE
jgi:hypothetical protein